MGAGGFRVVNLFAFRATDPRDLKQAKAPNGPDNDAALRQAARWSDLLICAWGLHGNHQGRADEVVTLLKNQGAALYHLGLTKDGHPRHPLYLASTVQPGLWR